MPSGAAIENAEEPLRVELTCYQVLHAADDARAAAVLEAAYCRLQERAGKIADAETRRMFLENVPFHRELLAAWREQHG
jgi:hypothetical protein